MFVFVEKHILSVLSNWLRNSNTSLYPLGLRLITRDFIQGKFDLNSVSTIFRNSKTIKYCWNLNEEEIEIIKNNLEKELNIFSTEATKIFIHNKQILCDYSFNLFLEPVIHILENNSNYDIEVRITIREYYPLMKWLTIKVHIYSDNSFMSKSVVRIYNTIIDVNKDQSFFDRIYYSRFKVPVKDFKELSFKYLIDVIQIKDLNDNLIYSYENSGNNRIKSSNFKITKLESKINGLQEMLVKMNEKLDYLKINTTNESNEFKLWLQNDVKLYNEYFDTFINNGYDSMEIVIELTENDLINVLGIKKKGHRIKLLKCIEKYKKSKNLKEMSLID